VPKKIADTLPKHEGRGRNRVKASSRKRLYIILGISLFVVVLLGLAAWVGALALSAKNSLEHAQTLVGDIKDKATAQDIDGAVALVGQLKRDTQNAVEKTNQPIWTFFEGTPFVGSNLTAVREISTVIDNVVTDAIDPIVDVAGGGLDSFKPVDGRIDVNQIKEVSAAVAGADDAIVTAISDVDKIETAGTVEQITAAKAQLADLLGSAGEPISEVRKITDVAPGLLGGEGPRTYIMLFPNNAESVSLGGNTAAWVLLKVTDGLIEIAGQPSSADFSRDHGSPIPISPELAQIYDVGYFAYATNIELRPDFPTAASLAQGFWQRETGQVVDGVVSFDPIALSYLLEATGPLTLPSGQVLAADNAVRLLLSDVYSIYKVPAQQDAFFAEAAAAVFGAVTKSTPDIPKLVDAITRAIDDDRLMAWSTREEEQSLLVGTKLEGVLAADNVEKTELGVFFVENSASKMSYYLHTATAITNNACVTPEAPTFNVSIDLNLAITAAEYRALPAYVKSQVYTNPVKTRTLVYVYGPVGGTYVDTAWNKSGLGSKVVTSGNDLGRPVVGIAVDLRPGESSNVSVNFAGAPGEYGPLDARVTPMINPTAVSGASPGCE